MGFVTLSLFALLICRGFPATCCRWSITGSSPAELFLCIGMVYDRTHTRQIADYGDAASVLPVYAALFIVFTLPCPRTAGHGFIGQILIILGGFAALKK